MANLMKKTKSYTFIDLFAGAGGLSEGFIRAGYTPIAHIEMNKDACNMAISEQRPPENR